MNPLEAIKLAALMERSSGDPGVMIGLIDGPVLSGHPDLSNSRLRSIAAPHDASCGNAATSSCVHGTFVAGVLSAARGSPAPAICPECTLLIRPIFVEKSSGPDHMPGATPQALATALFDCIDAGARIINLSLGLAHPSIQEERTLNEALDHASARGVIIVAAAGNQGTLGSTAITRHPWVIPVVACDLGGRPIYDTNLGTTMGWRPSDIRHQPRHHDGQAWTKCTGRQHHQSRSRWRTVYLRRDERCRTVRDGNRGAVVVARPDRHRHTDQIFASEQRTQAEIGRSALIECRCRLSTATHQPLQEEHLMSKDRDHASGAVQDKGRLPHRVRLPGFVADEQIGLGDAITRTTSYLGIKPCGGCQQRAAALNRWMVFTR